MGSALAPSDGNNFTGTIDGLIRVLLIGAGFLPSEDFEPCPYDKERVFEKCDALGERVSNTFRVIDAVQNAAPDASMLGAMLSAPVAHLKSLDFISHQKELFEHITQFLERERKMPNDHVLRAERTGDETELRLRRSDTRTIKLAG